MMHTALRSSVRGFLNARERLIRLDKKSGYGG